MKPETLELMLKSHDYVRSKIRIAGTYGDGGTCDNEELCDLVVNAAWTLFKAIPDLIAELQGRPTETAMLALMHNRDRFIGYRPEFTYDDKGGIRLSVIDEPMGIRRVWYVDAVGELTTLEHDIPEPPSPDTPLF